MYLPFFISKKYTLSRKDSKFITFISTISILGIALGVATLIIALSILNGFANTLTSKIIDFDSHIEINSYQTILPDYHIVLPELEKKLDKSVVAINPFVSKLAIISSGKIKDGINIKGIRATDKWTGLRQNLVEGNLDLKDTDLPSIVIGKKLANKLLVKIGSKVTLFGLSADKIPSAENPPNIERFVVTGIFESGMAQYDDLNAYVSLKSAQDLFSLGDNITGYDIKAKNISKIDSLTTYLSNTLTYPNNVKSIYQMHRNIFTWIELQKKPIPIILALIIIVAAFNIVGTLLMIVLEKTRSIGILKSLGAKKKQIISIFLYQGIFLALIGIIIGNLLAYILSFIQLHFHIISIPSSVYMMSTVPILLSINTFVLVSAITFVLCIFASVVPSFIAAKINPINAIRFN
ncbi:MAG: ABC transporter permease [Ignavibacteriaceae bacterium]